MKLLDNREINQKIQRLAYQILEHNYREKEIILAGINNNGVHFAQLLYDRLQALSSVNIVMTTIQLNPASPLATEVTLDLPAKSIKNKVVIIVDDVANTGRTIFYAFKPLMEMLPKKVEVAVLVDRKHKSFPILVDYVGLSLATTIQEHIDVKIKTAKEKAVFLD
ncbi:MAG: phosphoribosyltransferase family protein [Saprospiraceae bacterium]